MKPQKPWEIQVCEYNIHSVLSQFVNVLFQHLTTFLCSHTDENACIFQVCITHVDQITLTCYCGCHKLAPIWAQKQCMCRCLWFLALFVCLNELFVFGMLACLFTGMGPHLHMMLHQWKHCRCVHTYIHTYMHAYIHTYIHTCIHICIHTLCFRRLGASPVHDAAATGHLDSLKLLADRYARTIPIDMQTLMFDWSIEVLLSMSLTLMVARLQTWRVYALFV
jgi:hypothetical protein